MFWNELTSGLVHTWSLPAQFAEAGVVDAEVEGDLVDDGAGGSCPARVRGRVRAACPARLRGAGTRGRITLSCFWRMRR